MKKSLLFIFLILLSLNFANLESKLCLNSGSKYSDDNISSQIKSIQYFIEDDSLGAKITKIDLFPNPVHDYLWIYINMYPQEELDVKIKDIKIIDCAGITRKVIENATNQMQIDVRDLAPGVYFCKITTYLEKSTRKFLKI